MSLLITTPVYYITYFVNIVSNYHQGHLKPWVNYLTLRKLIIINSKWCVTWRTRQAVLGFSHPSVGVDRSSWTWVLMFWPCPRWAVMTHWTLVTPQQRAITAARTIKTIQTKQGRNNLILGCFWWKWDLYLCLCVWIYASLEEISFMHVNK